MSAHDAAGRVAAPPLVARTPSASRSSRRSVVESVRPLHRRAADHRRARARRRCGSDHRRRGRGGGRGAGPVGRRHDDADRASASAAASVYVLDGGAPRCSRTRCRRRRSAATGRRSPSETPLQVPVEAVSWLAGGGRAGDRRRHRVRRRRPGDGGRVGHVEAVGAVLAVDRAPGRGGGRVGVGVPEAAVGDRVVVVGRLGAVRARHQPEQVRAGGQRGRRQRRGDPPRCLPAAIVTSAPLATRLDGSPVASTR